MLLLSFRRRAELGLIRMITIMILVESRSPASSLG